MPDLSIHRDDYNSDEEFDFSIWLLELEGLGMVDRLRYEPIIYPLSQKETVPYYKQLKTKKKEFLKHLFAPHVYTPDFEFWIKDDRLVEYFISSRFLNTKKIIVDVKGVFMPNGGQRVFSINQKWMYKRYGYYVEKIVPKKFFKKTFVPEACKYNPVRKTVKADYEGAPSIGEFLDKN